MRLRLLPIAVAVLALAFASGGAHAQTRAKRDAAVWQAWNGRNGAQIMRDFAISRRLLYSILSRMRKA